MERRDLLEAQFRRALERARLWEQRVSAWCVRRGWFVLPTYDYSGQGDNKAPKLIAPTGRDLVLPDLLCLGHDKHADRWVECKFKSSAAWYRVGNYRTTGIGRRLHAHYSELQDRVRMNVWITFIHEAEREVRAAPLSELSKRLSHEYTGTKMGPSGMVFWKYDEIPVVGTLEDLGVAPLAQQQQLFAGGAP